MHGRGEQEEVGERIDPAVGPEAWMEEEEKLASTFSPRPPRRQHTLPLFSWLPVLRMMW